MPNQRVGIEDAHKLTSLRATTTAAQKQRAARAVCRLAGADAEAARTVLQALGLRPYDEVAPLEVAL